MSLPELHFEAAAPAVLAGASETPALMLDKIRTMLMAHDWEVESQEADSVLVALSCTPPNEELSTFRVVFAGVADIGSLTPPMQNIHQAASNRLLVGMAKNIPAETAFGDWHDANPYGTGTFFSYVNFGTTINGDQSGILRMWLSDEALIAAITNQAGTAVRAMAVGALLDPLSDEAPDAETNGRVYAVATSGVSGLTLYWLQQLSMFSDSSFVNSTNTFRGWVPQSDTVRTLAGITHTNNIVFSAANLKTPAGVGIKLPIGAIAAASWGGILRGISMVANDTHGTAISRETETGIEPEGWILGYAENAIAEAALIHA